MQGREDYTEKLCTSFQLFSKLTTNEVLGSSNIWKHEPKRMVTKKSPVIYF